MFSKLKKNALYKAVKQNKIEEIAKLAKKSALVEYTDPAGYTAVTHAAMVGNDIALKELLAAGVDPNHKDGMHRTPLYVGALCDRAKVVKVLIEAKCAIDLPCLGASALETAINARSNSVVNVLGDLYGQWLLEATKKEDTVRMKDLATRPGVNLEKQDITGWTSLHFAFKANNEQMVNILAVAGADPLVKNKMGHTPFDIANDNGNLYLIRCFRDIIEGTSQIKKVERQQFKAADNASDQHAEQTITQEELIKQSKKKRKSVPYKVDPTKSITAVVSNSKARTNEEIAISAKIEKRQSLFLKSRLHSDPPQPTTDVANSKNTKKERKSGSVIVSSQKKVSSKPDIRVKADWKHTNGKSISSTLKSIKSQPVVSGPVQWNHKQLDAEDILQLQRENLREQQTLQQRTMKTIASSPNNIKATSSASSTNSSSNSTAEQLHSHPRERRRSYSDPPSVNLDAHGNVIGATNTTCESPSAMRLREKRAVVDKIIKRQKNNSKFDQKKKLFK